MAGFPHSYCAGVSEVALGVDEPAADLFPGRLHATPNPFQSGLTLRFALPQAGDAQVSVYDLGGRLVRRLHRGVLAAGSQRFAWDGRNEAGHTVGAGLYVVRLEAARLNLATKVFRVR